MSAGGRLLTSLSSDNNLNINVFAKPGADVYVRVKLDY